MEIIFEMNILLIIGLPLWIIIRGVILLFRRKKGDKLNLYKEIITNLFVISIHPYRSNYFSTSYRKYYTLFIKYEYTREV